MKLGDKAVVQPGIGICTGEGSSDPYFGAGFAYRLSSNANMTVNLQTGISYLTFDGGNETTIPIGAAFMFKGSSSMSWYAGGSLWWMNSSYSVDGFDGSASDTNPVIYGGAQIMSGSLAWTLGGQLLMGDNTEFGIVLGANMNKAASAIQSLPRLFRK